LDKTEGQTKPHLVLLVAATPVPLSATVYASNQLAALIPLFRPGAVALGSLERLFLFAGFESAGLNRCAIS